MELVDEYESKTCKPCCKKYIFKTQKLYENQRIGDENAVKIVFPRRVKLIRTSFLMNTQNLLTGFGGAISSGQTLMWIIVTILGLAKALERFAKRLLLSHNKPPNYSA